MKMRKYVTNFLNGIIYFDRMYGTFRITFVGIIFLILLSFAKENIKLLIPVIIINAIISFGLICSKVPEKKTRLYLILVCFCVIFMLLNIWSMSVIMMEQYILDKNVDVGLITINLCLFCSTGIMFSWFYKWKGNCCRILDQLIWNILHIVNFGLILFAFGMLNFTYSVPSSDKTVLVNKIEEDSCLLYFGRFVYTGAIPALYGKDIISKNVDVGDNKYLTTVYNLGMSFSYDELIVLNEFIFVAGYVYIGYTLKPFK